MEKEKIRPNIDHLEPYFFAYILENPSFINMVDPISFKNASIRFVYELVRNDYKSRSIPKVPNNNQILSLLKTYDHQGRISKDFLKDLLKVDIGKMIQDKEDNYLPKMVRSWAASSTMNQEMLKAIDYIRNLNPIDFEDTSEVATKVREMMNTATMMDFGDEELGSDFDDIDAHVQDIKRNKISTGWSNLDDLLGGGWDKKTLNIIAGGSNSGKSLWLTNVAVNAANQGKNVVYFSLEMSESKIMKRLGSIRLKIPIDEYDDRSKDKSYMQDKLKKMKTSSSFSNNKLFSDGNDVGKIIVKEFPAASATVSDIENHLKKIQDAKGIKIDMIVVDYLTIMCPDDKKNGNLYTNGKQLAEGLRAIGQKHDICCFTAIQIGRDALGAGDISMSDISESKSIYETADLILGIVRTDQMRAKNKYQLKLLKQRDGSFKWLRTQFDFNTTYLSMENDTKLEDLT